MTRGCWAEPGKASRPAGPCQTKILFGETGSQNQENHEFHTPHVAHGMHWITRPTSKHRENKAPAAKQNFCLAEPGGSGCLPGLCQTSSCHRGLPNKIFVWQGFPKKLCQKYAGARSGVNPGEVPRQLRASPEELRANSESTPGNSERTPIKLRANSGRTPNKPQLTPNKRANSERTPNKPQLTPSKLRANSGQTPNKPQLTPSNLRSNSEPTPSELRTSPN